MEGIVAKGVLDIILGEFRYLIKTISRSQGGLKVLYCKIYTVLCIASCEHVFDKFREGCEEESVFQVVYVNVL